MNSSERTGLISGVVDVLKFSYRFRPWVGKPIGHTYGGKAVLDSNDSPAFAELALIPIMKQPGFDGALWVDSYRKCFRDAMPPAKCELPPKVRLVYERIANINGGTRGCWDVVAWKGDELQFVECKRKGRDRLTENEIRWLESPMHAGFSLVNFAICEWNVES